MEKNQNNLPEGRSIDLRQQLTVLGFTLFVIYLVAIFFVNVPRWGIWWTDFLAFHSAGEIVRQGEADQLYDFKVQKEYQTHLAEKSRQVPSSLDPAISEASFVLRYLNSPLLAVMMVPFSLVSLEISWRVWAICNFILLAGMCWIWWKYLMTSWSFKEKLAAISGVLCFAPIFPVFNSGQLTFLIGILLTGCLLAWRAQKPIWAGLFLSLLVIKPQLGLYLGIAVLFGGYWKILLSTCGWSLGIFLSTSLLIGVKPWFDWVQIMREVGTKQGIEGVPTHQLMNLRALLLAFFPEAPESWIGSLTFFGFAGGAVLVAGIWVYFAWRNTALHSLKEEAPSNSPPQNKLLLDNLLAFTLFLMLPLSPHLLPHSAFVAVLPSLLFYRVVRDFSRWRVFYGWFLVLSIIGFLIGYFPIPPEEIFGNFVNSLEPLVLFAHAGISLVWLRSTSKVEQTFVPSTKPTSSIETA
ncbi:Hypothetical protein PBC10988_30730 [Planctomycetales bacterium 10988]|nr:Hypothetical protein PBC10988_30730 [Planctomycetales bacterium 10988]